MRLVAALLVPVLPLLPLLLAACSSSPPVAAIPADDAGADAPPVVLPAWMPSAQILVSGPDDTYADCRSIICRHNENTDLTTYEGAIYLVHRTAISQTLGPNSALHVYRSTDGARTFNETARIDAPADRDIRDPHFYQVGGTLFLKALERLPVASVRDSNVDTVTVAMQSTDGVTWTAPQALAPHGWSFWRIKEHAGTYYSAAYQDGDRSVVLHSSSDGLAWTAGATVYGVSADTPVETELTFMPSGRLLALVRTDGTDAELLGDEGRLRTKVCWSAPPYAAFDCSLELDGQRLDGPLTFFWQSRLFVVARKHDQAAMKKRTSLFEITGTLEGGPISIAEWGEIPSAGDTSYAGVAMIDDTRAVLTWYSGNRALDHPWVVAMFEPTDIWQGTLDLSLVH